MQLSRLCLFLGLSACASGPGAAPSAPIEDEADHLGLALEASGFSQEEQAAARTRFDELVFPWVRDLAGIRFPEKKAKALLVRLHGPNGPLRRYDARASSLRELLGEGRYNCVSASVLYNLAAERIGVDASAELLPTHARSLVHVPGTPNPVVVETTSSAGFDPPPELQAQILEEVAAEFTAADARSLVPEGGARVSTRVLIAAILVNRASLRQEAGEIEAAAQLFEQGEALAPDDAMRVVLGDQRAALVSQLAAADALSGDLERLGRGFRTLFASSALRPVDPEIRRVVARNFRVVVERRMSQLSGEGEEDEALARLAELSDFELLQPERSALRAFTLGEVARARSTRGESQSALTAMDAALAEPLGTRELALRTTLEHNHWQLLRRALGAAAKAGDVAATEKLLGRAESVVQRGEGRRAELEQDRKVVLSVLGQRKLEMGDARGAAQILREGIRRFTADPTLRHNLLVALQRLWVPLVDQGRCEDAESLWVEAREVDPASPLPKESRARCFLIKANQRIEARDLPAAASWLAQAAAESTGMSAVDENLGSVLVQWARSDASACPEIVESARGILARRPSPTAKARAESALAACTR